MKFGTRSLGGRMLPLLAFLALVAGMAPRVASADRLLVEPDPRARGYVPIEELSHEVLVEPGEGFDATMRVRTALYNASNSTVDFVHLVALPEDAELIGVRTARDGVWSGDSVVRSPATPRSVPPLDEMGVAAFSAFATTLDTRDAKLAAAKVFGWGIESGETVQVELVVRVRPTLRGSRWTIDLPRRGEQQVIHDRRGILVRGQNGARKFWVDGQASTGKLVDTRGADGATVAWAATLGRGRGLLGHAEAIPNTSPTKPGGMLRVYLQAGTQPHQAPDHLSFLLDASGSVRGGLLMDASSAARRLMASTDHALTVDALAFDRETVPLFPGAVPVTSAPNLHDSVQRAGLIDAPPRAGTDIVGALDQALRRLPPEAQAPAIVVFSDGMFPRVDEANTEALVELLRATSRSPQIIFVIDDPLLARAGLGNQHPASELAARIGARIRSIDLDTLDSFDLDAILSAPRVIGDIKIRASAAASFPSYPEDLIGGNVEIVEGSYGAAKPPTSISVRALSGRARMRVKVPVRTIQRRGEVFVSGPSLVEREALVASVPAPQWYRKSMEEPFRAELGRASFDTQDRVGTLSQELMVLYLRRRVLPHVKACYNEALKRDGTVGGRLIVSYQIAKGEVMMASVSASAVTVNDPAFDTCLERAAWKLEVPAGRLDTRRYDVRYPIHLTPPEGGKAASSESEVSPLVQMMLDSAEILAR